MLFPYHKPPEPYAPGISFAQMLKDHYTFHLSSSDYAKYRLTERYWKVLPYRLIREYNALKIKGRKQGKELMANIVYRRNPFLENIPKDNGWSGKYIALPLERP